MRLIYFSAFVICLFAYTFFVLTNHEIGKQMFLLYTIVFNILFASSVIINEITKTILPPQ